MTEGQYIEKEDKYCDCGGTFYKILSKSHDNGSAEIQCEKCKKIKTVYFKI